MIHSAKLAALALQQIAKVLDKLTEDQLTELAEGRAVVEFRSGGVTIGSGRARSSGATPGRAAPKVDIDVEAIAGEIKVLTTSDEVRAYLDGTKFKLAELKEIARALGPSVSATGRTMAIQKENIVDGTVGFREGATAVFPRGWGD